MLLELSRWATDSAKRTSSVRMLKLAWWLRAAASWLRGAEYISDRRAASSPRGLADGRPRHYGRPSALINARPLAIVLLAIAMIGIWFIARVQG